MHIGPLERRVKQSVGVLPQPGELCAVLRQSEGHPSAGAYCPSGTSCLSGTVSRRPAQLVADSLRLRVRPRSVYSKPRPGALCHFKVHDSLFFFMQQAGGEKKAGEGERENASQKKGVQAWAELEDEAVVVAVCICDRYMWTAVGLTVCMMLSVCSAADARISLLCVAFSSLLLRFA